ncbi:hypothetical protein AGMMS50293_23850 [Spirochaetia bacterium]|nr:hypothetical protein AGMMS50293_23850 [Spirochaetia bacterium]
MKRALQVLALALIMGAVFTACPTDGGGGGDTTFTDPYGIEMADIPAGTFMMGSPISEVGSVSFERPQHEVTLSAFKMSKHEVTQAQWEAVMGEGTNPSWFTTSTDFPVEQVSWYDAIVFCNKLSLLAGLDPVYSVSGITDWAGLNYSSIFTSNDIDWDAAVMDRSKSGYRLPTEAEWEYACRAGTSTRFWSGDDELTLEGKANVADLTGQESDPYWTEIVNIRDGYAKVAPVGTFAANSWGLYDMHGNVWEWCWDWYGAYGAGPDANPTGADFNILRVYRGGSWFSSGWILRSAQRDGISPSSRYGDIGFRLVRAAH